MDTNIDPETVRKYSLFVNFSKPKLRMIADTRASLAATQHQIDRAIRKSERCQKRARKTLIKIDQLEEAKNALNEMVGRTLHNLIQDPDNLPSGPVDEVIVFK